MRHYILENISLESLTSRVALYFDLHSGVMVEPSGPRGEQVVRDGVGFKWGIPQAVGARLFRSLNPSEKTSAAAQLRMAAEGVIRHSLARAVLP